MLINMHNKDSCLEKADYINCCELNNLYRLLNDVLIIGHNDKVVCKDKFKLLSWLGRYK